jgi:PRTRC genetic system protein A
MIVKPFIAYNIAVNSILPDITASMMEYWLAGNGIFVRAARLGLSACVPISNCAIAGLPAITPYVQLEYPLVPPALVLEMLHHSQAVGDREILFYLWFANGKWQLDIPKQLATSGSVRPLTASLGTAYETASIEIHSHHSTSAGFSAIDDLEESGKFRIFGVLGEILTRPTLNLRIGIYSHFWQIPACWIFHLPSELSNFVRPCT